MTNSLVELLMSPEAVVLSRRYYGVVTGRVTNNQDPLNLGRVRVNFPSISSEVEGWWARIAVPMASNEYGTYFLPEVDDEVLVMFENGDFNYPYVIGALWNTGHPPPTTNEDGKNNQRLIRSRSGMILRFDDTAGKERIEISDQEGKNIIVVDVANQTISITADSDITIESKKGKVQIKGNGIELVSNDAVKVESTANMDLKASGQMTIKGALVNIN